MNKLKERGSYHHGKNQADGIRILLGVKGYDIGQMWEEGDRIIVEIGINGRKIYLRLKQGRWKCCDCGHTFSDGRELVRPYCRLSRYAETEFYSNLKRGI